MSIYRRFWALACATCLCFLHGASQAQPSPAASAQGPITAQRGDVADPEKTTLTAQPQRYPLPPRRDSRSVQSRAQIEAQIAALEQKVERLDLTPACARVLRDAARESLGFVVGLTDNDGTDAIMLYASMACPPKTFSQFWFKDRYTSEETSFQATTRFGSRPDEVPCVAA